MPLLVTRPDPGCTATVTQARALGLDARAMPLFIARPLDWVPPDPALYDALLITSAQAARLGGDGLATLADMPAYAVGEASAQAARGAGLKVEYVGDSDGQTLVETMAQEGLRRILWLSARDRSRISVEGTQLTPLACYAVEAIDPPSDWQENIAGPAAIAVYSRRSAERLAMLVGTPKHLTLIAISSAVAAAAGSGWKQVAVASHPNDAAMLAQAHALCHKASK
ncbi:uroporphyrinogen-III synthase [Sphingopyxis sp. MWB1]|uniref:uroporphyrinogen-III synthase n=1 Tax=Sphingopyxis sp. MWB1 TaxID=1537715 RepID=UPI001F24DF24|nr:uroporphyrinogen-III synthase [Sphingopyxis sp. MWB1]